MFGAKRTLTHTRFRMVISPPPNGGSLECTGWAVSAWKTGEAHLMEMVRCPGSPRSDLTAKAYVHALCMDTLRPTLYGHLYMLMFMFMCRS